MIYMTVITNLQSSFKSTYWKELHLYFTCAQDRVEGFQGNPLQCSIVVGSELLYPSDANSYRYLDIAHLYIPTAEAMLFLYHRDPRHRKSPSVCVCVCVCFSLCHFICVPCVLPCVAHVLNAVFNSPGLYFWFFKPFFVELLFKVLPATPCFSD